MTHHMTPAAATAATKEPADAATDRPLAVITGASSGIGLELARQFVSHGFDIIVAAEADGLAAAAASLRAEGDGQVTSVQSTCVSRRASRTFTPPSRATGAL
jgi:NAD(P)-dependent dehydrogenase (short-subunit alcohol dehydrogenase family)